MPYNGADDGRHIRSGWCDTGSDLRGVPRAWPPTCRRDEIRAQGGGRRADVHSVASAAGGIGGFLRRVSRDVFRHRPHRPARPSVVTIAAVSSAVESVLEGEGRQADMRRVPRPSPSARDRPGGVRRPLSELPCHVRRPADERTSGAAVSRRHLSLCYVPHAEVRRARHASPVHGSSDPVTAAHSTVSVARRRGSVSHLRQAVVVSPCRSRRRPSGGRDGVSCASVAGSA
jgi:hypothetical protein